jgi:hypothetical protein
VARGSEGGDTPLASRQVRRWLSIRRSLGCPLAVTGCCRLAGPLATQRPHVIGTFLHRWVRLERMLTEEADREALKQFTQAMFRAVTRHKERGFRNARATTAGGAK